MLIQLGGGTLHSDNSGNLSTDIRSSGHLPKFTSSKLKKLIQPVLIQLVGHTLRLDIDSTIS